MLTSLAALFDPERSVFESEAVDELALMLFFRLEELDREERDELGSEPIPL
jgi:hypothetical protein